MPNRQETAQFWTQVETICDALQSDVYLPSKIEAHVQRTSFGDDQSNSYTTDLRSTLESVEPLFRPDADALQAHHAFQTLDAELEAIENRLQSLVSSLEGSSATLRDFAHRRVELNNKITITSTENRHLSEFVERLHLSDRVEAAIKSANPHSEEFKHALQSLSRALALCTSHKDAPSVLKVRSSLTSIRDVAIRRIDERWRESFRLMRDPASTFAILRETLLEKQKPLVVFLRCYDCGLFNSFMKEYVDVAKLAFETYIQSHYRLLVSRNRNKEIDVANLDSITDKTSKMLSSIWGYGSTALTTSDTADKFIGAATPESHQPTNEGREELVVLTSKCVDALRNSLNLPLTAADIRLKGNALHLSFCDLFRELVATFLSYEKAESRFVTMIFEEDGCDLLPGIFPEKENLVLSCLEDSIENLDISSGSECLCISLYICRCIRESITDQQRVDHRVMLCVLAERLLQTRFLRVVDSAAASTSELLRNDQISGVLEKRTAKRTRNFASLVSKILVVAQQGDKWVHSQDLGYVLRRRLHSCVNMVLDVAEEMESADYGIRATMLCSMSLLSALDICASLSSHHENIDDIRALAEKAFLRACKAQARAFEVRNFGEIDKLQSAISSQPLDKYVQTLAVIQDKLSRTEHIVRDSMNFLSEIGVDSEYEHKAVDSVLSTLRLKTEAVKETLSRDHSQLAPMLEW